MTHRQKTFFAVADKVSELSNHPNAQLGCVVVEHGRIISSGSNSYTKTHPLQKKLDKFRFSEDSTGKLHSEVAALLPLLNARVDLRKASIYVSRRLKNGSLAMARPCKSCMRLIKNVGIKRVYYTTDAGFAMEKIDRTK